MVRNIAFTNANNEKIIGILKEKNPSETLIVVCHGFKSSKKHPANGSITDKLYAMGHATFSFDFSPSAQGINIAQQVSDIQDTVAFFKKYKHIILLAGSFGALSAAIVVTQRPNIKGLITINGFFGSGKLGKKQRRLVFLFRLMALFRPQVKTAWKFLKENYQPEKVTCPTLVIHAKYDKEVLIAQSQDFFKRVTGKKAFHVLENADHHLTRESYRQEIAVTIDHWLKST